MSFWDQVRRGASKAATEAGKQTTIARLNYQMGEVKTELGRKTRELGDAALALCRQGELTQPSLTSIYGEITALEARIAELETQIADARGPGGAAAGEGD